MFTRQVKVQIWKSSFQSIASELQMPTQAEYKQPFHPSLLTKDAPISIF